MNALGTAMELRGDVLLDNYAVTFGGRRFRTKKSGETVRVFDEEGVKPLGTIRAAGAWSGSIWADEDCIGEYYFSDGAYNVVPVGNGFRESDRKTTLHPLVFLLQHINR
jgi:hypothetical protein